MDARSREERDKVDKTNANMTIASTEQQKLAPKILDEKVLTKEELDSCYNTFGKILRTHMEGCDSITSTEVLKLLEDAIDMTKPKQKTREACMAQEKDPILPSSVLPTVDI